MHHLVALCAKSNSSLTSLQLRYMESNFWSNKECFIFLQWPWMPSIMYFLSLKSSSFLSLARCSLQTHYSEYTVSEYRIDFYVLFKWSRFEEMIHLSNKMFRFEQSTPTVVYNTKYQYYNTKISLDLIKHCSANVSSKCLRPLLPTQPNPPFFHSVPLKPGQCHVFKQLLFSIYSELYIYFSIIPYLCHHQFKEYFLSGCRDKHRLGKWRLIFIDIDRTLITSNVSKSYFIRPPDGVIHLYLPLPGRF